MTPEKEKELNRIRSEMEVYDRAIAVFDYKTYRWGHKTDKELADNSIKTKRFAFLLECFKKDEKPHVRLNVKGFFGGDTISVDQEFVDMCLEYFKKKRKELDEAYEKL